MEGGGHPGKKILPRVPKEPKEPKETKETESRLPWWLAPFPHLVYSRFEGMSSVAPAGLGVSLAMRTQDLRPGLLSFAPAGLKPKRDTASMKMA